MSDVPAGPVLLTVAGFDPSSGAGVTADLAVFAAHDCFGLAAVTALTVQSTTGVRRVEPVDATILAETLQCLEEDLPPAGIKLGMLADQPQVDAVSSYLQGLPPGRKRPYVVLDPVLSSSSGRALLTKSGLEHLLSTLLPMVDVVTPNTVELALLTGLRCDTDTEIEAAMQALAGKCPGLSILATGGHRPEPDDILLQDGKYTRLRGVRVETSATHGTGCALSSALLCGCVHGHAVADAAAAAKAYVVTAMQRAEKRGSGKGPLRLLWPLLRQPQR